MTVARALVGDPCTLLADEPTGNLDSKSGQAVMVLLTNFYQKGVTIYMVTHNPEFFKFAQRSQHLFDGRIVDEQRHSLN